MCYTTWGVSIGRVSLVDVNSKTVLDMLIKPTDKLIDLNTRYSGLTELILHACYDFDEVSCELDKTIIYV
jgi:RNA exonuclease 1